MRKDFIAVTVSDPICSKYYFIKKSLKRDVLIGLSGLVMLLIISLSSNVSQLYKTRFYSINEAGFKQEILKFGRENSQLNQIIRGKEHKLAQISKEVVNIEQFSGMEVADIEIPLEERVALIGGYYSDKEVQYSEIGDKVEHLETIIGLKEGEKGEEVDLKTRVNLASLSARQERILHDNIPNGFPLSNTKITSTYGKRKHPVTKIVSFHKGVDLRAKTGSPIFATADGIVREATQRELSGKRVNIVHNFGFESRFSHLDKMFVKPGDFVQKGDTIGEAGNTGRTNGPHLHYEVRYLGQALDPKEFLEWDFGEHEIFEQVREIRWPSLISLINKQITHQTLQLSQLDPMLPEK